MTLGNCNSLLHIHLSTEYCFWQPFKIAQPEMRASKNLSSSYRKKPGAFRKRSEYSDPFRTNGATLRVPIWWLSWNEISDCDRGSDEHLTFDLFFLSTSVDFDGSLFLKGFTLVRYAIFSFEIFSSKMVKGRRPTYIHTLRFREASWNTPSICTCTRILDAC